MSSFLGFGEMITEHGLFRLLHRSLLALLSVVKVFEATGQLN
jgi:hypothetical protein